MARKKTTNNKKKRVNKYQGAGPFRDDAANKALRNAGITFGASTLTRGVVSPLMQNRRADRAAYNQYMGVMDRAYQNSGYDSYADYCLTGDCPQNPFQGNPPTFRDWRKHDYFGAGETNARPTYRFINDVKENPLQGTMGPAIKAGARDAAISGALTYGANKLLDNTRFGRNLKRNFNVNLGFRRAYQPGGAVGNPYAQPTSAATSGYTSTMSGMAGAEQARLQLAQLQQESMAEQSRRAAEAREQEEQDRLQFRQDVRSGVEQVTTDEAADKVAAQLAARRAAREAGAQGRYAAQIAQGTADAAKIAKSSKDTTALLNNLGAYGTQAKTGADAASAATSTGSAAGSSALGPAAAAAALGGKAIEFASDDQDDTRTNFGEGAGRLISGAGTGVGLAASLGSFAPALALGPLGLLAAGVVGGGAALLNQRRQKLQAREEEDRLAAQDATRALSEQRAFEQSMTRTGTDMGYNIGSSMTNSYLPGQQQFIGEAGGPKDMIKRADGSYSQRGLWDNIRANKGSGKKPTKEMLEQEKKIKAEEKKTGGYINPLPGGAVEFVGPKHAQGGIMLDENTEVEGGETMDKVTMASGGAQDYIFSDFLKLGKKTFAQRHKEMLERGASQAEIQKLAKMQEEVAKREGRDENGPRDPDMVMQGGGPLVAEEGVIPALESLSDYNLAPDLAYARDFPEGQSKTEEGLYRRADGDTVTMNEVESLKANNPWYDWEGFDPTNPEDVKKFQAAYNEKVPEEVRIKVDGKVGEQTVSAYIPYRKTEEAPTIPPGVPNDIPEREPGPVGDPIPQPEPDPDGLKLRKDPLLPWQLMGPLAELSTKYPQPNKIAAQPTGRIKLPRVNYNAERASLAGSTNATNKFIQNQSAGPGAITAMMATNEKQRAGNLDIANAEARTNKELAAREELGNLQASQFDSSQAMRASMFNAQAQNQRDQNEYEKRMLAFNQLGTNLTQYGKDLRAYKAEERFAEASQIDNEYTRQKYLEELRRQSGRKKSEYYGMNDTQLKEIAAKMVQGAPTWNAQNAERRDAAIAIMEDPNMNLPQENTQTTTQSKRGGYVRKLGGVRRKRKRK